MSAEVAEMISLRHAAEQKGNFSPLGRLLWMDTEHGRIEFPRVDGVADGPDLACVDRAALIESAGGDSNLEPFMSDRDNPYLLVLGTWNGLPSVRANKTRRRQCPGDGCEAKTGATKADCTVCFGRGSIDVALPCPACLHDCDACGETGFKLCELCGGNGWTPGNWVPCPGPGCNAETGNYKGDCQVCAQSMTKGMVRAEVTCGMCNGSKEMVCPQCKGARKYSTGRLKGSINWDGPACGECEGTCKAGEWKRQDEKKFAQVTLRQRAQPRKPKTPHLIRDFLAIGPIHSFALMEFSSRSPRIFEVTHDSENDLLMMLVPAGRWKRGKKAYLVGGVVRERGVREAVGA
jgi:hypothetical protein